VSDNDGMGSNTQVPIVRRVWASVAMSCHAKHLMLSFPEAPALTVSTRYRKPLGEAAGNLRASRAQGERQIGLTCDKNLVRL
jgi:hypothetical protein